MSYSQKIFATITLSLISFFAFAQNPIYSNEFLKVGVGGRALAMGNTHTAIANDVTAGFWNPAGLNHIKSDFQVGVMHNEHFAGIIKYDYLGFAYPFAANGRKRVLGLSVIRMGVDDIPNTLKLFEEDGQINYNNVTAFSVADYAGIISYAQTLNFASKEGGFNWNRLGIGGNVKVIHRKVGDFANAWGFGIDLGAQYNTKKGSLGVAFKDITTTVNAWSFQFEEDEKEILDQTGNIIPVNSTEITNPTILLGAAYKFAQKRSTEVSNPKYEDKFSVMGTIDFEVTTDGKRNTLISGDGISIDPKMGIEAGYREFIFVRAGLNNFQKVLDDNDPTKINSTMQPNFGIGIQVKEIALDYALTSPGSSSPGLYSHVFSLKIGFDRNNNQQ